MLETDRIEGMRTIKFENIENFRDLGGYPCSYGETSFGVIYRSAALNFASEKDVDKIASLGIKTVLDLRDIASSEAYPDPMKNDPRFLYFSLPVNGGGRIPTDVEDQLDSYMEMLEDPRSARAIFKAILACPKPLVFHCTAGKDRTGAISMVLLLLQGVPLEDVNADYMLSYPLLPKMTAETRKHRPDIAPLMATPNLDFFPTFYERFMDRYGSLEDYFEAIGISDDDFKALSSLLGKQETSYGAVVFREGKVLVEHMGLGHYSLPKGHVESFDKDGKDTARRELFEETDLTVSSFYEPFETSIFYSPCPGVLKKVTFFAVEAEGEVKVDGKEVSAAYWLSPEDAYRTLSFDSDRMVLKNAVIFVQGLQEKENA